MNVASAELRESQPNRELNLRRRDGRTEVRGADAGKSHC